MIGDDAGNDDPNATDPSGLTESGGNRPDTWAPDPPDDATAGAPDATFITTVALHPSVAGPFEQWLAARGCMLVGPIRADYDGPPHVVGLSTEERDLLLDAVAVATPVSSPAHRIVLDGIRVKLEQAGPDEPDPFYVVSPTAQRMRAATGAPPGTQLAHDVATDPYGNPRPTDYDDWPSE